MRLDVHVACFYMRARRVVSRFDAKDGQELSGYNLYQSLLTYVAHMHLVGDPLQDTCHTCASKILITRIRKILYVGYRRIFP
jgi:hypothetical protein